jgi:DNA (cytosine-5)-methyltransferase 1
MLEVYDLCAGIGGFSLAGQWLGGFKTTRFVEINKFCQQILTKNFPGIPIHDDLRTFSASPGACDLITAGFPCQPHSQSGKRQASGDERDLWPELYRVICEIRPRWIVLENVPGLLSSERGDFFRRVLWDLAQAGFDAEWAVVSCADLGAAHRRNRLWIVAYPQGLRRQGSGDSGISQGMSGARLCAQSAGGDPIDRGWPDPNAHSTGLPQWTSLSIKQEVVVLSQLKQLGSSEDRAFTAEPTIPGGDDGVPRRVDRVRGLGNSVSPQVAMIPLQRVLQLASSAVSR